MNYELRYQAFWMLALLLTASCTKVEINGRSTQGSASLTLDWGAYHAPAGMRLYFYKEASQTRAGETVDNGTVVRDVPASGFVGSLPVGTYQLLGVNTDATGIELRGMEHYETATAALPADAWAGMLYSFATEKLDINNKTDTKLTLDPQLLVRQLRLLFYVDGAGVSSLTGSLCGLYPSVLLSTGKPSASSVLAAANTRRSFTATLSGEEGMAELNLFGMLDPENGSRYTNVLTLNVTPTGGTQQTLAVDLSKTLTEILNKNSGELPVDVPVEIGIQITVEANARLSARVTDWRQGNGEGDVIDKR